mmetsp:Transcript_21873/g.29757  ORF Transcript_21873/g.29757 Transcript_21873/m.29757 type:complete len:402 (-) Transcript_21873:216-1421(-)|eukprot:CAMPEP_0185772326 /NCGR_PEP_ID=MMETSP1174-20130828/68347_1 /TAXON_ID=35687 /ORGANISM="Dictyocha speculum, Strain CCMP1381" /LENGTH=401 /DNA_ID=CAMNT_0028458531 /DNA_START=27 /DNA_END=1232 /DNA_ORIENTATION=+
MEYGSDTDFWKNNSDSGDEVQISNEIQPINSTQLASRKPQIDSPLRVDPPDIMKVPERAEVEQRDDDLRESAYSANAFSHRNQNGPSQKGNASHHRTRIESSIKAHTKGQASHKTAVADYRRIAFSSNRAGKKQMEGQAYLSMGIIYDNLGEYHTAIDSYSQFLSIAKTMGDPIVEGLAYNCLGVNYMLMACPPAEGTRLGKVPNISDESKDLLRKSIKQHQSHLSIADSGGQFVAHTNLGLCYGLLEEYDSALDHHESAMSVARDLETLSGQSVAAGNLGLVFAWQGDTSSARTHMDEHLELVEQLDDPDAELNAWIKVGEVFEQEENYEDAIHAFDNAMRTAETEDNMATLKLVMCKLGLSHGNASLDDHMERALEEATGKLSSNSLTTKSATIQSVSS